MTLLKAYKMYLKVAWEVPLDQAPPAPVLEDGAPLDQDRDFLELSPEGESVEEEIKQPPSVRKWCRENYINANRMARVRRTSRQIWTTLQQITRPLQHRRDDLAPPQHHAKRQTKLEAKLEKESQKIEEDVDTSMTEIDDVAPPHQSINARESRYSRISKSADKATDEPPHESSHHEQDGGFIQRIRQQEAIDRLEPHVRRFPTEEENIMMSLAIGNFVNLAIRAKQGDNVYVSCFATTKKFAKISQESFLGAYGASSKLPNVVMYDEMFQSSHEARFMKLNLVNKIPDSVFTRIKELHGNQIKYCL